MSTIKVNSIKSTSTTDGGISINTSGHVTVDGVALPSAGPLSSRNLIVNGGMQVAQYGTTKTGVSDGATEGYATVDRFAARFSSGHTGVVTNNQSTEVPTGQGFATSYHVDVTTAVASPTGSMRASIRYKTEAQDLANSGWNHTSTSSYITLSFWARSSKTGAHCIHIVGSDTTTDRYYLAEYSLTADTWERITISIPGHANSVINNDNGIGFEIDWILSVGPDVDDGTSGAWHGTTARATSNQVNVFDSTDGEFYLTGVQLELGEVATPFEHRLYFDELARCQRYYYRHADGADNQYHPVFSGLWYNSGGTDVYGVIHFPVKMRSTPSLEVSANGATDAFKAFYQTGSSTTDDASMQSAGTTCCAIQFYNLSGGSSAAGDGAWTELNNSGAHIAFTAEL